jgi:hypothetical protein
MSRKNRNLAAKAERAKAERAEYGYRERIKSILSEPRLSDGEMLVACLARQGDIVAIGGRAVRKIKTGVTGRNVAKLQPDARVPAIIAAHW